MSYSGYNTGDAIVMNKSSIDRGFGRCTVTKKYAVSFGYVTPLVAAYFTFYFMSLVINIEFDVHRDTVIKQNYTNGTSDRFCCPNRTADTMGRMQVICFIELDLNISYIFLKAIVYTYTKKNIEFHESCDQINCSWPCMITMKVYQEIRGRDDYGKK